MRTLDMQYDTRSKCMSILTSMKLWEYKTIAEEAFQAGGNLQGQRDVIRKSSTASKIRKRMQQDFIEGAIFPAVVLGVEVDSFEMGRLKMIQDLGTYDSDQLFHDPMYRPERISIIDGMQRSNIYFTNYENHEEREIRVEFWVSDQIEKLLYRMLVLNTGQVPWNTRRQIEVIYSNLADKIREELYAKNPDLKGSVEIMTVDDEKRRTQAGKYQKSIMIQLYLGFNTRKVNIETSEQLAEEYQRFDMIDSMEKDPGLELFVEAFSYLCRLDIAFSECEDRAEKRQFDSGKSIFGSIPACIGFIVACAEYMLGKISVERSQQKISVRRIELKEKINRLIDALQEHRSDEFLALDVLNDVMESLPKNRIGDDMRNTFKTIFTELLRCQDFDEIESMESFWRV